VKNSPSKKVGAVLLGEIPSNDEKWSGQFIQTCGQRLNLNGRNLLPIPFNVKPSMSPMYQFTAPLSMNFVDSVCKANHTRGLITVDYFGAFYEFASVQNTLNAGIGLATNNLLSPTLNGVVRGYAGFRYYDPESGQILLQQPIEYYNRLGQYSSSQRYIQRIPTSTILTGEAYLYVAQDLGEFMASYFVPTQYWDYRKLNKSGNAFFKAAFRYARSGNWEMAVGIWQGMVKNPSSPSEKWKALYNLAVYNEINSWFDQAESYASEAYALSGKRKIYKFSQFINYRRAQIRQATSTPIKP
jgi:hypothetical protein